MSTLEDNRSFVVLTTQRSGSTWVIDVLSRLDNTKVYGELFLQQNRTWDAGSFDFPRYCESSQYTERLRWKGVFSYLDDLYSQPGAVGFKLMYSHLIHYPEIMVYLFQRRRQISILHLIRKNYLNVIVSREMVRARGEAHLLNGAEEENTKQVYLDPKTLIRRIRWARLKVSLMRRLLNILNLRHFTVGYEELLENPTYFDLIREFLGLDTETEVPQSGLRKITRSSHDQTIRNYEDVRQCLVSAGLDNLIH